MPIEILSSTNTTRDYSPPVISSHKKRKKGGAECRLRVLDSIARLHERLRGTGLACGDAIEATLLLTRLTTLVNSPPPLALPWRETPKPDRQMLAAHDDTFANTHTNHD